MAQWVVNASRVRQMRLQRISRTPGHLKQFIVDKVSSALSPKPRKMAVVSDSDENMDAGSDAVTNISDKEKIKVLEEKLHARMRKLLN